MAVGELEKEAITKKVRVPCMYLEVNTNGGNHVTDQEESSSDQRSLARTNTLQPGTVDGSRETKETDGDVEGDGRVVLVGDLLVLIVDFEPVELLVDRVVEDGPSIEGTANGLEDEGGGEHEPAVVGHAQGTETDGLFLLDLSICAVEGGVVVVVRNVCEGATGGHLDSHSR